MRAARRLLPGLLIILSSPSLAAAAPRPELRLASGDDVRAVAWTGELRWAATAGGLLRLAADGTAELLGSADGLPAGKLYTLLAEEGGLWVGGEGGLVQIAATRGALKIQKRIDLREVHALARFGGRLYIGTWGAGLHSLGADEQRPPPVPRSLAALESITALAAMPEGLYLGTAGRGLLRLDGDRLSRLSAASAPCRTIFALAAEGERLWVGSLTGLGLLQRGRPVVSSAASLAAGLPVRDLRAILPTEEGLLLGSFGGGLHRLRAGKLERLAVPAEGRITALGRGPGGLLVGSAAGLYLQRGESFGRLRLPGPPSNDISSLAPGRSGLWVGTFDAGVGLYRQGRWRWFDQQSGMVSDWVNQLAVEERGGVELLWVATPGGVSRYDGQRWQSFLPGRELAPGHVNSIQVRGARVIFGSSKGVSILEGGRWLRLERAQGMPLRGVTVAAESDDGALWVGGLDGLARWHQGRWDRFRAATGELPDDWVTALLPTARGLWVGTYNRGLALRTNRGWQRWGEADGMPCGWVNLQALAWQGSALWVGTMEGGLLGFSGGGWQRLQVPALPSLDVTAVVAAPGGRLWVGTRAGVVLLGAKGGEDKP